MDINFKTKTLEGTILHTFQVISSSLSMINLDIEHIYIHDVINYDTKEHLKYKVYDWPWIVDEPKKVLSIFLTTPYKYDDKLKILITYSTDPDGLGLNWLNENQTASNESFFYTDCQTIYCRSVAPLQDTPSIKAPFTAKLRVNSNLTALSSGFLIEKTIINDVAEYKFEQPNPVPSYLIAILAGKLIERNITSRTRVYAEPTMINDSVKVLEDLGSFLDIVAIFVNN